MIFQIVLDDIKVGLGENDFVYVTVYSLVKPSRLVKLLLEEDFNPLIVIMPKIVRNALLILEINVDRDKIKSTTVR